MIGNLVVNAAKFTAPDCSDLRTNRFTLNWNWMLKGGLIAHGAVIVLIGIFFVVAAWQADPSEAGGHDRMFGRLSAKL